MHIDWSMIRAGVFRLVICFDVHARRIVVSSVFVVIISVMIGSIIVIIGIIIISCSTSVNCLIDQWNARRLQ